MKNDETLIREFQSGRKEAFDELAKKYLPNIYQLFYSATQNREDAEDLTQTSLFKLYSGLSKFRFEADFTTYLYRINSNVLRSYYRKKKIRSLFSFMEPEEADLGQHDDQHSQGIETQRLWDHIGLVPAKQRLVLILRLAQELPFKQIGAILNMQEGTAKVNYHYAIKRLRTHLEENE
ncbi:MAG: RNA polymerase sigma factor [Fidelibacterota bacterium]